MLINNPIWILKGGKLIGGPQIEEKDMMWEELKKTILYVTVPYIGFRLEVRKLIL